MAVERHAFLKQRQHRLARIGVGFPMVEGNVGHADNVSMVQKTGRRETARSGGDQNFFLTEIAHSRGLPGRPLRTPAPAPRRSNTDRK